MILYAIPMLSEEKRVSGFLCLAIAHLTCLMLSLACQVYNDATEQNTSSKNKA